MFRSHIICLREAHTDCRALGASATPLLELGGHSHWVWQAKYNPHHDSLLLSASSDSLVNLWHTPISAGESSARGQGAPRGPSQTGQKGFGKEAQDGLACTYDDHEDSVYGMQHSWSKHYFTCFGGCLQRSPQHLPHTIHREVLHYS